jgi:hypothetical protein
MSNNLSFKSSHLRRQLPGNTFHEGGSRAPEPRLVVR